METPKEMADAINDGLEGLNEKVAKAQKSADENKASIDTKVEDMSKLFNTKHDDIHNVLKKQGETLSEIKQRGTDNDSIKLSLGNQIHKFVSENEDTIKNLYKAGVNGGIEFQVKAVGDITTGSGTIVGTVPSTVGTDLAPVSNVNLRNAELLSLTTNVTTTTASYPYTDVLPKEGGYTFIGEGDSKTQIDKSWETRFETPVKVAAWERMTEEVVQDIPRIESVCRDFLLKQHNLKKQDGILFGDGTGNNPLGATVIGRTFVAGDMANAVTSPTIMDIINAAITDIYTTHNFTDEAAYKANLVIINPVDFYLYFSSAKDNENRPLFPTATLFDRVNIGGVTVIPDRSIPAGKLFVCDMSKYNTTNYLPYTVKMGWINDDFIKNQFVILAESRFHAFVKELDKQAFIYDDIATVEAAITAP